MITNSWKSSPYSGRNERDVSVRRIWSIDLPYSVLYANMLRLETTENY